MVIGGPKEVQGDRTLAQVRAVHGLLATVSQVQGLGLGCAFEFAAGDNKALLIGERQQLACVLQERRLFQKQAHFSAPDVVCANTLSRLLDLVALPCELPK